MRQNACKTEHINHTKSSSCVGFDVLVLIMLSIYTIHSPTITVCYYPTQAVTTTTTTMGFVIHRTIPSAILFCGMVGLAPVACA